MPVFAEILLTNHHKSSQFACYQVLLIMIEIYETTFRSCTWISKHDVLKSSQKFYKVFIVATLNCPWFHVMKTGDSIINTLVTINSLHRLDTP